jgi:hypothetical protein
LRPFTASIQHFAPGPFFSLAVCGNCVAITAEKQNKIKRSTTTFKARGRIIMRVSTGIRVLISGLSVLLGFFVSGPKALAQG